jgi:NitT/TauT family transport system ATP-binding protein
MWNPLLRRRWTHLTHFEINAFGKRKWCGFLSIVINNLRLAYDKKLPILDNINLEIQKGECISIIGKSGCGKSSLLKCVAGLIANYEGDVFIHDEIIQEPHEHVSYLFQNPILLEWRSVLDNVLLPLELKRKVMKEDRNKAKQMMKLVGLQDAESKYPHECSGGMKARAALARMLITEPDVLLLDEPFSSLDAITKGQLQKELLNISQAMKPTIILVTHDIEEAVLLSNRVFLLGGKPACVSKEFRIDLSEKRDASIRFNERFINVVAEIYESVERL